MRKVKKFLVPALLVVFLMLTVVGSAPASDEQAPLRAGGHAAMVVAADCQPQFEYTKYTSQGSYLYPTGGAAVFFCPVDLDPSHDAHWVYAVYLSAYDNHPSYGVKAEAYKSTFDGNFPKMGEVSSSGQGTGVRTFVLSGAGLTNRWVLATNRMYIRASFPAAGAMTFYGVRVMYY